MLDNVYYLLYVNMTVIINDIIQQAYDKVQKYRKAKPLSSDLLDALTELRDAIWNNENEVIELQRLANDNTIKYDIYWLLDVCIKEWIELVYDINISLSEKIWLLWIKHYLVNGVILPTELLRKSNEAWSITPYNKSASLPNLSKKAKLEKMNGLDKVSLFLSLLYDHGIHANEYIMVSGETQKWTLRYSSYIYIYISKYNKTILMNPMYGELTFVRDGLMELDECMKFGKNRFAKKWKNAVRRQGIQDEDLDMWWTSIMNSIIWDGENAMDLVSVWIAEKSIATMVWSYDRIWTAYKHIIDRTNKAEELWYKWLKQTDIMKKGWKGFISAFKRRNNPDRFPELQVRIDNLKAIFDGITDLNLQELDSIEDRKTYASDYGFLRMNTTELSETKAWKNFYKAFSTRIDRQSKGKQDQLRDQVLAPKSIDRSWISSVDKWRKLLKKKWFLGMSYAKIIANVDGEQYYNKCCEWLRENLSKIDCGITRKEFFPPSRNLWWDKLMTLEKRIEVWKTQKLNGESFTEWAFKQWLKRRLSKFEPEKRKEYTNKIYWKWN